MTTRDPYAAVQNFNNEGVSHEVHHAQARTHEGILQWRYLKQKYITCSSSYYWKFIVELVVVINSHNYQSDIIIRISLNDRWPPLFIIYQFSNELAMVSPHWCSEFPVIHCQKLSWSWLCRHGRHRGLSKWQLLVPPLAPEFACHSSGFFSVRAPAKYWFVL